MMASEELRNAIDSFDYRQYLKYKGLSDEEIPETLDDGQKQALFRRAHEDAYADMVKAYKADPFMDNEAAQDKAREDLLKGREYLRPLFGLWEEQRTAEELYRPETVIGEALRQNGIDVSDPNLNLESIPENIRFKELAPYIERYANAIVNDNLKYNAPELAGINKKTFIENFRNINGISDLDTINDLIANTARRNAEQARQERIANGEESSWSWLGDALDVGSAGGAGMVGNSAVIAGSQGNRLLDWMGDNPIKSALGSAGIVGALSLIPGLGQVLGPVTGIAAVIANEEARRSAKEGVDYINPENNSWIRRNLMELETGGMRLTNEAMRVRNSLNYVPKYDRFLEDYAKDWDLGGFMGRITEQAASNWPSVVQNIAVPLLGSAIGSLVAGPAGTVAGAAAGLGFTTAGSVVFGAPLSAGDALADLTDHGVYDTFEQNRYLPYVSAAVTLDYLSTLALHSGFSGLIGRGVNAGIGAVFTSRAEREAAKQALKKAAQAQGMNWNTIQSVAGRQLLKLRAAELAGASSKAAKFLSKGSGPVFSFLEEMYTEQAQEDIAMQLINYGTSSAFTREGGWESLKGKFLEGGVNPRNWSPIPGWGRESMFAQYEDGARYNPRMYNERLLSAGLVGGLMGAGTHIFLNTEQAIVNKLMGRGQKQDADVIATDANGNTVLMRKRQKERDLARSMFATMQLRNQGVNAQTVVGVDLQDVGGAFVANFNGVTGTGRDASEAFMDLSVRANANLQKIDTSTIAEVNGGWEATLANKEKLRVVGTNAEQILRDLVTQHNSYNHPMVIRRGATIEHTPGNAKPWKITRANGITVRAETLYDNYALYDFSTNASGNFITDTVIRRKGKRDLERKIDLSLTQTGNITFTDQLQNIQSSIANTNGKLVLLDATVSKKGTKNPRVKVNGSVTNDTMRVLDTESGIIYTLKLKKGKRNSNAHVNVSATSLDGRRIRLDPSVAKQMLRDASNSSALTNEIRLSTPSTGITIQGETVAGQSGWHFKADQIAEITRLTGAQLMSDPQRTDHLEFSIPSWVEGREQMEMLVLDIDQNGKVFATANGETIEIEGINDRYTGEFANETAGRILAETEDTLQVQALTGGTFEMVGNPDASTGAVTLRRQTAAGSTIEVTIDRRGNLTNFRLVDDPSIDLQTRIDEGITRRNQRTQAQQTQQAQLGQISDPDLATFTEEDLVQLGLNPATINAELKTNFNNNISSALRGGATFAKIEANLEKMGFPPGRFLYQDILGGGHWVLRDRDGKVIGHYTNDKRGLTDLQHMSHARIEAAFGTNNIVPYVLEQFVDGIRNRGYTTDVTNVTNEDYAKALEKYLSYYDAVFGPEQESYVSSTDRETLVRQRLQQRWQDIYDGRVVLSTIQDALKFYGNYIQRGYRLYDYMNDTVVDSNFARVEPTDASAFINERDINSVPRREGVGIIDAYMIGDRIYDKTEILKAAHQKNNLDTIQYDQMENLAQQELQKYTETPSVRARRGERRYIDRLNRLIREEVAPLLLMNNLDDVIAYYEGKGGNVGIYRTYIDHATGMYIGKDGQQYSKVDINTSDVVRQLVRWKNNTKPSIASNAAEEGYFLQRPDGSQVIAHEVLALVGVDRGTFMETLKRADTMMAFLDTIETNDRVNDALAQETQEAEATALTRQEAEDQIIAELFEQAQVASTGADFLELYRGQLQKRYVVRDLDSGLYKSRNVDSVDLSPDNFLDENEVRDMTMPTNYDIVGYWVLYNSDDQTVANFDTDANFNTFSNRLRNQDMLDVIDREELVTRRVEESEVSAGQQNARRETLRQQREAVAAQAQAAAQAAQQPTVNPASAPDSIPYAETLVRMFGNEALVSLSNKVMLFGDLENAWSIRDANYQLRKVKGEYGARNINDPRQSLDREMRRSFARKLWRSALRRKLVRVHKTLNDFYTANPQAAEQLYLEYGRGMVAASRQQSIRSVTRDDADVINYVNALTDEQKLKIRTDYGPQGYYSRDNGTIDLVEEMIPNEMGVTVFFHELAVHATSHLTKDLNVAWERIANFLRTQAKGRVDANGKKTINKIGLAVHDIIQNRGIIFNDDEWGFWEEVAAYFVADHINNLSFAQNIKALFRRWFRQTGIVAQGEDITVEDILHFARHAAKVGISRANDWKTSNYGKDMYDSFSAIGSIYHRPENVVRDQMSLLYQHYQEDRNMDMMGMVYDRATGLAQHSNLNRARWLLVRTPFYKHWFGDWENDPQRASKVVDGNGEPLLVPHARKHDAIAYDLPFTGFNGNFGYSGQYTYGTISDNPYLDRFSGSPIAQVFLNVRKPLQAHNYSHMSQTMRRLGFQESTVRLDLRSMLNDMVEDTEAYAVMEGITRYSEDENPRGSFADFLILNDDLLATVFPNASMREAYRFVTGLFEAATTPSGSILVEEPVTGASTTEEYAESLGEEERRHLAEVADIFDRHLEGFENQMVRLSYNPDGYFTAFSRAHDDVSMSTRETITDVLGAIDQRAQEYREADMLTFKEAVARAYEEISTLQESEISNDEAFLNILNLALHKLRREELAVRLGIEPITIPAYPTMPTRMMLKENNLQLAERLRGEMLRQGFDGLWGTDDILLLHPDQAHEALEFVQPYGNVSTGSEGVTMTPYERSIMEAVENNLARDAERLDVPLVRLRSEYRSIYQAFAPSAPWIKSNLDEYNWVLVRTPSFKENFGDWQNDATEDMWLDWRDEPVRTSEGFLNGETIVRTEEGYFSSISAPAFGRLAGTREYSQAIDQAALENLFGVTDLTEERIALEQQIRDLQTQDAELVTRIQAIQAQIAAVQARIPNVQDRQPQQVFADPQLIAERDALLARAEELRLQIAGIREGMTESVTPGEAVSATDRLREVETLIAGLQRSLDREFDSPLFSERYLDVTRRRHERLRTELENLRTQLGSMNSDELLILDSFRAMITDLDAQIEEQRSREENFANTLNELLRQRNDAVIRRDIISEEVSSLNDQLVRKARERLLQEKESLEYKLKQMRESDSTGTRAWMREENVRLRISEIENFLEIIGDPEGSTARESYWETARKRRSLTDSVEVRNSEIDSLNSEIENLMTGIEFEDVSLLDLINERERLYREIVQIEQRFRSEQGASIRNAPGRIAELEARIRALGFELEAAQEEDIRRAREAWERKARRTAEEARELNDLLNEREALRRTVGNYEAGNIVRGLATVRERLLEQAKEVNRQIFDKFKRESRKQTAEARNRIRRTRQIMRRQAELQARNTDTLRELADVTDALNTIREDIRNRPGRAADEARAAQLMLGAERLENEKWEFIDEMAEMMWEVSQMLGNVNAVIRDNPGASQTALNAMNARKADLSAQLDNLRYQILNGSSKLDEDIVLARQEAQDLLQLVDPLTEQTITDLENRQDEIIARQQEIEAELDTLDERLMNLTGTASEAVRAMKDSLLEQLDQLNAQRGALAVRQTELSRQKTLAQRAIDQRSNTLNALNRVDAYALAGQLEAMGHTAEHIRLVTGFEKDKEGNWTYRLSNRDATFRNPIFIIEERLRELYKMAGLRMKPSNATRFKNLRLALDEYHQLYRNQDQGLSESEMERFLQLEQEIHNSVSGFSEWVTGNEKTRIAEALKKRGMQNYANNIDAYLYAPVRLINIFHDAALFTAYPELNNTQVDIYIDRGARTVGGKITGENHFNFNLGHLLFHTEYMSAVLHEIQHQIQEWETWSGGTEGNSSTPETMRDYLRNYGEFAARYAGDTWHMTREQLRAYNQDKFLSDENTYWNDYFKNKYNVPMRPISSDELILGGTATSSLVSSIMPHGQQRQADVVYPDFTETQVDGYFSLSKTNREWAIREMRDPRRGRPDLSEEQMGLILDELDRYDQPKKQKLMLKWMLNGSLAMPIAGRPHHEAYQVDEAMELAAKAKVDPFGFESPVDILNRYKKLNPDRIPITPESVPELDMNSRIDHGDGIVSYQVQDNEAGQKAVRRIINSHWGKNWSNWCLTRANTQGQLEQPEAWDMWHKYYNALPKRVAFKNGKIISLMATDDTSGYRIATTIHDLTHYVVDDLVSEMAGDPRPLEGHGLTEEEAYMFTDYVLLQEQTGEIIDFEITLRRGIAYDDSMYLNRAIDFIKNRLLANDEFELDILNNPAFSDRVKEVLSNPDTLRDELGKIEMMDEWFRFSFQLIQIVQGRQDEQRDKLLDIDFYRPRQVEDGALEIVDRNGNFVDLADLGLYGVENRFYWNEKERAYVTRTSEKWWDQNNEEHSNLDWARDVTEGYRRRRSAIDLNTTLGYFSGVGSVTTPLTASDLVNERDTVSASDLGYFSMITNGELIDRLNKEPKVRDGQLYRMVVKNDEGIYYPVMATRIRGPEGDLVFSEPIPYGEWEQADERPELIFVNDKGKYKYPLMKDDGGRVDADYAPYIHSSTFPLNDQFTTAYKRPNLVVLRVEVPQSEITHPYRATFERDGEVHNAPNQTGIVEWNKGTVTKALGRSREVVLSRYGKAVEELSDAQVADIIVPELLEKKVGVPINVVTPGLLRELVQRGVEILNPVGFKTQYATQRAEAERLTRAAESIRSGGLNSGYFSSTKISQSSLGNAELVTLDTPEGPQSFYEFRGTSSKLTGKAAQGMIRIRRHGIPDTLPANTGLYYHGSPISNLKIENGTILPPDITGSPMMDGRSQGTYTDKVFLTRSLDEAMIYARGGSVYVVYAENTEKYDSGKPRKNLPGLEIADSAEIVGEIPANYLRRSDRRSRRNRQAMDMAEEAALAIRLGTQGRSTIEDSQNALTNPEYPNRIEYTPLPYFSAVGNIFGRTSNYNLDIYDREEIQGSGGAYRLRDGRIFIDPNEVGEENVARVMLYALIRENQAILSNENIARAVAIIREWENSANDEWRNLYNRIRSNMNAVHAPDSALLAYAVREFMANGTSAINPTNENGPEGAFAAILREIPAIMGQAAGVSTNQVTAMPSDVITVTNALSGINNDTIDVAVPSLNMDQRTFEALETKATAPAFMDAVMQDVKRVIDEYDNVEFQFINGLPHIRMGDLVLNLATDPMFARNIVDQILQNTVDMGNHDLTDRQNPGEEQDESMKLFGDLAKRLPQDARLLGNAQQADVEKFIKDNIPAYIADRIRVFYEETEESKAIFGEEYNGRFRPLMADREVIFIKAYGNRSLADVVGTTVKMVSMFGWNMWNNADFIPLMNELYTALEHNIRTELPSYYNKIRGRKPNSAEKSALISAYLASKSTSIYELSEFARSSNVPTTREQELIDLGKKLRTEIDKVSLHMAESFASDFSQNEELVKEYTEKLLRLTMAPFHGQGLWLAYDLDYDRVRQTNPDAALALQKWENLSRVTVFANDFGPTYTAEPVTDEAISNAMMVRKFRNASPFMQKVWRFYWRNWHPPQKHIGDTILGTENTVMLGRAFRAITEDLGISMRNVFQNVAQFREELLNLGIDTEEFDGRKGYEQELRDRGITKEKVIAKAVITDSFLRFGRQRMLENVIEIRRLITANTQKLDFWMRRENVPERQIQKMHAEMNAFANKFISDWEHRSYRAYTERGQDDLVEMYRILDGSKGRTNFASTMPKIMDEINNLEKKKNAGQISKRAYARERKKLRHKLKLYERLDALYNWANQSVMARLPARPSQAQTANVPKDTIEAMKKEIDRVRTLVTSEKERGIGGRMEMIPGVRRRKLDERNPHDRLYMTFLDQIKDPATAMLYSLDQQGKIMDKMIFNTRFGESILQNGMGTMRGSQTSTGLKVNNLSWMENGTFLRYVQIDSFFLDEIANEMKIQDALRDSIMGHLINLIKQNFTVLNWRMSISNWIGNLSNLIATGQIFRFRNWGMAFDMNKDKFLKNFIVDYEKTVKDLSKKDCVNAINAAAREYNANIAQYQAEMNKLNIWGSGLTSAQMDAYGQGGWEKVSDFLGTVLQSISEKTDTGFFDDVSKEKMARMTGTMMRYAREFYGFGDEWVKPLTYINNRAVALAKHRAINNWSRFEGRETDQAAIELDRRIREEAVREAALLTLKETTTWELSPDFARKITRNAARIVAPDFLLHQFQMVRIMAVNTQRIFECADEVGRLNAKGKRNWTPDEKVYYKLVQGEMIRRGIGSSLMTAAFALMFTSAFSLSGYLVNLMAGSLAGSGDSLEKRKRKVRDPNGAVGMDARDFEGTSKLCNVVSMISDLYAPIIWVPGKVGKEFYAYNDQRVNAAYTTAMVLPPSVNPSTMERLKNLALTLVNMETVPLTVQLVNLWHGKNSFGQNITTTEAIWETLSLLTPQIFHQGYHIVQGADRAMLGTEDLGWREKNRHRELSVFDIGGVKVRRISVDDIIENTGRKVKQLTSNENANRRVFLDTLQRNPDMSDRDIKIAVDKILASNKLEMDKIAYAMSAFRDIGVDRERLFKRLTRGRNTTSPILGENRANQLIEGRDVLSLILLTNLSERIKSIERNLDPDTDFSKDERRRIIRNLRTAMRMIQEAEK